MIVRRLGLSNYSDVFDAMKQFTASRTSNTEDEVWLLEHLPVYTQGQAGKPEHILQATSIPIIQADRGGQVTYHGPGQMIAYILMDIGRRKLGVKTLVSQLEGLLINLLQAFNIQAQRVCGAPGVYVQGMKIASIGLRVRQGCTYHGIALNVDMDLTPFAHINPCGYKELAMTQMKDFDAQVTLEAVQAQFLQDFLTLYSA